MCEILDSDIPEEYQRGFAIFLGCRIDLSARPLIPRPESEFWTSRAIGDLEKIKGNIRVLDIFSGSGCIGVAAAKSLPLALVDFCDIDPKAVEQIKINIGINAINAARVQIFLSDIFGGIPQDVRYDAILSNPPYIDPARCAEVQKSVLDYEPHIALFAGKGGLEIIEKFLNQAKNSLKDKGFIYMEYDPLQKKLVGDIIKSEKYSSSEFFKDQFGQWRFVKIFK